MSALYSITHKQEFQKHQIQNIRVGLRVPCYRGPNYSLRNTEVNIAVTALDKNCIEVLTDAPVAVFIHAEVYLLPSLFTTVLLMFQCKNRDSFLLWKVTLPDEMPPECSIDDEALLQEYICQMNLLLRND